MKKKKEDLPFQPWAWGDWFKAADVQALPKDVRCVWFEMIGRMWESDPRGYLVKNGRALNDEELTRLLGFGEDVNLMKSYIKILEESGIFSRDKDGIIYCRRTVRDEELRKKRSKSGKLGAEIRYSKSDASTMAPTMANNDNENDILLFKEGGVGEGREEFINKLSTLTTAEAAVLLFKEIWCIDLTDSYQHRLSTKLINKYGLMQVDLAFRLASKYSTTDSNKRNLAYVETILKNNGKD